MISADTTYNVYRQKKKQMYTSVRDVHYITKCTNVGYTSKRIKIKEKEIKLFVSFML